MLGYWWLLIPAVAFYFWLRKSLRRQQRELRAQPSRWDAFVAETRRLRRQAGPEPAPPADGSSAVASPDATAPDRSAGEDAPDPT